MADKIQNAYETSKNIYDDVLTQRNIFSKLYIKLFWSGTDDNDIARKVLSYVPDDFSGNLLDVPVGTAIFTENKWSSLKNAHITCIDYSMDMLEQARKRLVSHAHIKCIQGDVGNLQMENESVDTVVSMNGFHAFLDKQKAFHEIWRVLKPGGDFIACFYPMRRKTPCFSYGDIRRKQTSGLGAGCYPAASSRSALPVFLHCISKFFLLISLIF